jgi:hypothetical protein
MEEQGLGISAQAMETTPSRSIGVRWADLRCLAILVVLAVGLRTWQITHTEVASRDSIGYIRIAWQLEHGRWSEVIPLSPQHPAYPLAVLGMSHAVRYFLPDDLPLAWQLSSQLASALAGVLLVVPMFYLGRGLFDRRVAFWACVLFQCLPSSGKVMGDGLSDSLFLLFTCAGLWLACVALRRGSWRIFALTGLAGGLAYLTRPEGVLVVGATGLVLLAVQFRKCWRRSWKKVLVDGMALSLAELAVMTPYMLVIGGVTVKNTPNIMMHSQRKDADWEGRLRPKPAAEPGAMRSGGSVLFADWYIPTRLEDLQPSARSVWAIKTYGSLLARGFFYAALLPALLGLWWFRDRFRLVQGTWVVALTCLILSGLLYWVARKMGYLSDRHLLLIVLCGTYWAAAGAIVLGEWLAGRLARLRPALAGRPWTDRRGWSVGLLLLLSIAPLPRTLARLHAERAGFRSVGQWLAEHTRPGDFIEDPYCWASYYAGRVFLEGRDDLPAEQPPCYYVVLEQTKNKHSHLVSLAWAIIHASMKEARQIYCQEVRRGKENVKIEVFRVPGPCEYMPLPAWPSIPADVQLPEGTSRK